MGVTPGLGSFDVPAAIENVYTVPPESNNYFNSAGLFFNPDGTLKESLQNLIKVLVKSSILDPKTLSFDPKIINDEFQDKLLRKAGDERWHTKLNKEWDKQVFEALVEALKAFNIFEPLNNLSQKPVDVYAFFGSTIFSAKYRFQACIEALNENLGIQRLILLGSTRVLKEKNVSWEEVQADENSEYSTLLNLIKTAEKTDAVKDYWLSLFEDPDNRTEANMLHAFWDCTADDALKEKYNRNNGRLIVVNSQGSGSRKNQRATTTDTIGDMLDQIPKSTSTFLMRVEKPHAARMDMILRSRVLAWKKEKDSSFLASLEKLEFNYSYLAASKEQLGPESRFLSVTLDAFARQFYQEIKFIEYLQKF